MKTFNKNKKIADFHFLFLLFYIFWGWILSESILQNNVLIYISFVSLLITFVIKFIKNGYRINSECLLWTPFFIYTILGWFINSSYEYVCYWIISLLIIWGAVNNRTSQHIDYKFILLSGLFLVIGIGIQYFLPTFYETKVNPFFIDNTDYWVENYGYKGFAYQLGTTASILNFAEMVIIYIPMNKIITKNKYLKLLLLVLIIICTFMTGKRMNSIISIIIPIIVYFISHKGIIKKIFAILMLFILGYFIINFIQSNIGNLSESVVLRRTIGTYLDYKDGSDFTSDRSTLWLNAIILFKQNPLFGIGLGQFFIVNHIDVHNMYLQCLCEQGIIGLLLFILPLTFSLFQSIKAVHLVKDKDTKDLICFSIALQLIYIFNGFTENDNLNLTGFMIYIIGIAIMIDCKYRVVYNK